MKAGWGRVETGKERRKKGGRWGAGVDKGDLWPTWEDSFNI